MSRRAELRAGSVAALVLDGPAVVAPMPRRRDWTLSADGPASIVLGARASRGAHAMGIALIVASAVHLGIAAGAWRWADERHQRAVPVAGPPLKIEHVVDLAPSPSPPTSPAPSPRAAPRAAPVSPRAESAGPPAPVAAAQVVAAEPEQTEALDFTGFDIATGEGKEYAGGVTAASGTSARPVHDATVERNTPRGGGSGSRARPVGLPAAHWSCPWPPEAAALSIDEETVVVRVVVNPDGSVASTSLSSDPGHGFGAFAAACAGLQRFQPALDDAGIAITARSPPVRVHFRKDAR